jgi:hypothetical protein
MPTGNLYKKLVAAIAVHSAKLGSQVGMYSHRDQDKIEEYNRKQAEKQAAAQACASGKTDTDRKSNAEQQGGGDAGKPRASTLSVMQKAER